MLKVIGNETIEGNLIGTANGFDVDADGQGVQGSGSVPISRNVQIFRAGYFVNAIILNLLDKEKAEITADNRAGKFGFTVAAKLLKALNAGREQRDAAIHIGTNIRADLQDVP